MTVQFEEICRSRQLLLHEDLCLSLCYAGSNADYHSMLSTLNDYEYEKYIKLKYERRQKSYLLGRFAAKYCVQGIFEDCMLNEITIDNGIFNEAVIKSDRLPYIHTSISHSENVGAAIASHNIGYIGIDIELNRRHNYKAIQYTCTEAEKELFGNNNLHTLCWTAKEALSKVFKTGMTAQFKIYEVSKVNMYSDYYECEYANFAQYRAISFMLGNYVLTLALPKIIKVDINVKMIKDFCERIY